MKQRELIKELKKLGFSFYEHGANHDAYSNGKKKVMVPRHKELGEALVKVILKEARLE